MTTRILDRSIWQTLTEAARSAKEPAVAAVAYFAEGADKLLPLPSGSKLVVDCGDLAVKSGQTYPAALLKLHDKGVAIYRDRALHAKAFVIDGYAYVGSTNASNRSVQYLKEAVMVSDERACVADVRRFIDGLCLDRVGPDELKRLAGIYQKPKFVAGMKRKADAEKETALPTVRVINCIGWTDLTAKQDKQAFADGKAFKVSKGFEASHFGWQGRKNRPVLGDIVILISYDDRERRTEVTQPSRVIGFSKQQDADDVLNIVHVEMEDYDYPRFSNLPVKLRKLLYEDGPRDAAQSKQILTEFQRVNEEEESADKERQPTSELRADGIRLR